MVESANTLRLILQSAVPGVSGVVPHGGMSFEKLRFKWHAGKSARREACE